ncbi:hypothetical protein, partial [Candidatus Parabeggiatoa sp. HSG14]|uniref:hypothetical protein n=1 Tax=Candidatus Parabeggiatoa sp. HSG14 TaxID=3055593 RepID=UPI0025A6F12D|nr:hypothetical protein [Thiotrichales bacterium HSG14]
MRRWACSEWIEYQAWLFHYGFLTLYDWQQLRNNALSWQARPLISIVTPVFNTHPAHLRECIYSVQTQAYPNHSDTHIIYSDRDSLSPQGTRFMHLFKPNWSPETLLSGNYLF